MARDKEGVLWIRLMTLPSLHSHHLQRQQRPHCAQVLAKDQYSTAPKWVKFTKVWVCLRFTSRQAFLVIITKQFVKEVDCLVGKVSLVFRSDEPRPWLSGIPEQCNW